MVRCCWPVVFVLVVSVEKLWCCIVYCVVSANSFSPFELRDVPLHGGELCGADHGRRCYQGANFSAATMSFNMSAFIDGSRAAGGFHYVRRVLHIRWTTTDPAIAGWRCAEHVRRHHVLRRDMPSKAEAKAPRRSAATENFREHINEWRPGCKKKWYSAQRVHNTTWLTHVSCGEGGIAYENLDLILFERESILELLVFRFTHTQLLLKDKHCFQTSKSCKKFAKPQVASRLQHRSLSFASGINSRAQPRKGLYHTNWPCLASFGKLELRARCGEPVLVELRSVCVPDTSRPRSIPA